MFLQVLLFYQMPHIAGDKQRVVKLSPQHGGQLGIVYNNSQEKKELQSPHIYGVRHKGFWKITKDLWVSIPSYIRGATLIELGLNHEDVVSIPSYIRGATSLEFGIGRTSQFQSPKLDQINAFKYAAKTSIDQDLVEMAERPFFPENTDDRIPVGIKELDKLIDGFRQGEVTIIAGRPSMGKTDVMNHFALYAGTMAACRSSFPSR